MRGSELGVWLSNNLPSMGQERGGEERRGEGLDGEGKGNRGGE